MYLQDYITSQWDGYGDDTASKASSKDFRRSRGLASIGMDGALSIYSDENGSTTGSQFLDDSPYAAKEQSEEAILKDGDLRKNSRRKKVLRYGGILILAVTFFALVGSFLAQKYAKTEGQSQSCQLGVVQETKTPQLEIYMTGVSQLLSETEKQEVEQALTEGYNDASGICSDEYQRWMYNASLVNQEVHEKLVFTDQATRLENAFLDTPTLVTRFETKISCNQCADETAFSSIYPAFFGEQEHGRQLTNEAFSRLNAADALTAMERAVRRVMPDFQGFLEVNIITTGNDGSASVMTISKEHEGDEYLPDYFRDEALARVRQSGTDCDEGGSARKRGKSYKGSGGSSRSTKGSRGSSKSSKSSKSSSSISTSSVTTSSISTSDNGNDDSDNDDSDNDDNNDNVVDDEGGDNDTEDKGDKDKDDKDKDDKDKDDKDKDDKDKEDKDKDDKDKEDKDKEDKDKEDKCKGEKEEKGSENNKAGEKEKAIPDKRDGGALGNPACEVCGPGKEVKNPNAIFNWPGQEPVSCEKLQLAGQIGGLPADSCPLLPRLIGVCGCGPINESV